MGLRETINRNPQVAAVVAAVIFVLAAGSYVLRNSGGEDPQQFKYSYYMMLDSGDIIVDKADKVPPLDSGAVRAVVFSCSDCSDKDTHFVGWLEKFTDQAKTAQQQLMAASTGGDPENAPNMREATMAVEQGRMVAAAPQGGEPRWVSAASPESTGVRRAVNAKCGDGARLCKPLPSERP